MKIGLILPIIEEANEFFLRIKKLYGVSTGADVDNKLQQFSTSYVKTGTFSFAETAYHSSGKTRIIYSLGEQPILEIMCRGDNVITFRLDPQLFDEMEKVANSKAVNPKLVVTNVDV